MARTSATYFFATRKDLDPGIRSIEAKSRLRYVLMGSFDSPEIVSYQSALDLPDIGFSIHGDQAHERSYLVMHDDEEVVERQVPQKRGGTRYFVDQMLNPDSLMFRPCGIFTNIAIIRGEISTLGGTQAALDLYNDFSKTLVTGFKKVKSYYLGPEALKLAQGRIRLTHAVHVPSEYDLAL